VKNRMLCLMALAGLLAGCAGMTANKPGVTQAEFDRDSYECKRDVRQSGYTGSGIAGALQGRGFLQECMTARGYTFE